MDERPVTQIAETILLSDVQYVVPAPDARKLALAVVTLSAEVSDIRRRLNLVRFAIAE